MMFNKTENSELPTKRAEKDSTFFQGSNFKKVNYYQRRVFIGLILWVLLLAGIVNAKDSKQTSNLLENGDFEQLTKNGLLKGWRNYLGSDSKIFYPTFTKGNFPQGKNCLRLLKKSGKDVPKEKRRHDVINSTNLVIEPDKSYTLRFYAKSPLKNQLLKVYFYTFSKIEPHYYKCKIYTLTSEWKEYSFTNHFPNAEKWGKRRLHIRFVIDAGETLVDDVRLKMDTAAEARIAPYLTVPVILADHVNLLDNSGFELGWQDWHVGQYRYLNLDRAATDVRKPMFDTTEKVHGSCSLRMPPSSNVNSVRHRYVPGREYTCSFYAKSAEAEHNGLKQLKVFLITPKWKHSQLRLKGDKLSDTWKRYSFTFTPPDYGSPLLNSFYARIDNADNTVWVDSFKVESGGLSDYDFEPQIGFQTDAEDAILQLNRKLSLKILLQTCKVFEKPLTLCVTATNIYGHTLWEKKLPVTGLRKGLTSMPIEVLFQERGVADVQARLTDSHGRQVATGSWRCWVIDVAEPAWLNPLFGYQSRVNFLPLWACLKTEKIFSLVGAQYHREFLRIRGKMTEIQLTNDHRLLDYIRAMHGHIKRNGRLTKTVVGYFFKDSVLNCWNPLYITKSYTEPTPAQVDQELEHWGKAFELVLRKTSPSIEYYEIINELNLHRIRKGPSAGTVIMTPSRYIKMLAKAKAIAGKVAPQVKIGVCLNRIDLGFTNKLIEAGLLRYIDFFSFHSYQCDPENPPAYDQIMGLRTLLDKHRPDLPIFNSEQYFGLRNYQIAASEYEKRYHTDYEDEFVGKIIQNYLHHASTLTPLALFSLRDTAFQFGNSNPIRYYFTVGVCRALSRLLCGVTHGESVPLNDALRVFLFERADGKKVVSFNTRRYGKTGTMLRPSACVEILDVNGNPLAGKRFALEYLPMYAIYPAGLSRRAVLDNLAKIELVGLSSPLKITVDLAANGVAYMRVVNSTNQMQTASIKITAVPEGWKNFGIFAVNSIAPGKTRKETLGSLARNRDWRKTYNFAYTNFFTGGFKQKIHKLPSLDIPHRTGLKIDGDLADWKNARWYTLDARNLTRDFAKSKLPHTGDKDLSAKFAMAWDQHFLYMAFRITDDSLVTGRYVENAMYLQDSLQIYFDLRNNVSTSLFKTYGYDDVIYQIGIPKDRKKAVAYLEKNPSGRYIGAANQNKGIDSDVQVVWRKTDDGYICELAFPKVALPFLAFSPGSELGLDILINDNDGKGRKCGLTFGSIGDEPNNSPFTWKAVRLTD